MANDGSDCRLSVLSRVPSRLGISLWEKGVPPSLNCRCYARPPAARAPLVAGELLASCQRAHAGFERLACGFELVDTQASQRLSAEGFQSVEVAVTSALRGRDIFEIEPGEPVVGEAASKVEERGLDPLLDRDLVPGLGAVAQGLLRMPLGMLFDALIFHQEVVKACGARGAVRGIFYGGAFLGDGRRIDREEVNQ